MSARRREAAGGSRFLYEPFEFASRERVDAHERIVEAQLAAFEAHFARLEEAVDRLERRIWIAVFGVAGVVVTDALVAFLGMRPG